MAEPVKLSLPDKGGFFEIEVLFEDEHLFAINKPAGLMVMPDPNEPDRPSLLPLMHAGIEAGKPWAKSRQLSFLSNAHRIDTEASGVLLFARNKETLAALNTQFSTHEPNRSYVVLVRGNAAETTFSTSAKLAPHPLQMGVMRVDQEEGKRSETTFSVRESLGRCLLLDAKPIPDRPHQVRVHLKYLHFPVVGDEKYGGKTLWLSRLKTDYRLKKDREERPLLDHPALHLEEISILHPATNAPLKITAPWPKDLTVAVKYLRRYANGDPSAAAAPEE